MLNRTALAVWRFLVRLFVYCYLAGRCYQVWSWSYRWLFERAYMGRLQIQRFTRLEDLADWVAAQQWTADSWTELFDAVSCPEKVQALGQGGGGKVGDCDEFAIYLTAAIQGSTPNGYLQRYRGDVVAAARFLTVTWMDGWAPTGHNVCVITWLEARQGGYSYMDYGLPSEPFDTVDDLARAVVSRYSQGSGVPLVWAKQTLALSPERVVWA